MKVSEFPRRKFQTASEVAALKFTRHLLKQDIWVHAPIERFLVDEVIRFYFQTSVGNISQCSLGSTAT